MTSGCGKPLPQKIVIYCTTVLAAFSTGVIGFKEATSLLAAFSQSDYVQVVEVLLVYGMLSWMAYCVLVSIGVEMASELVESDRATSGTDYQSFYQQESHSRLLILVPSYREEPETIWQTLMSAALAEHPNRDVVLLIDDPSTPLNREQERLLRRARAVPIELQCLFDAAAAPFESEWKEFQSRKAGCIDLREELCRLAALYESAAEWLNGVAQQFLTCRSNDRTHTEMLFVAKILQDPARHHCEHAAFLRRCNLSTDRIAAEYMRLASLFRVRFDSFERKQYANLSHAPNKAMNLNSYLALVGCAFKETTVVSGKLLEKCDLEQATMVVPKYRFVVSVDADSLITSDYNVRLVAFINHPENGRYAIAQSPYTAIPDAPTIIERVAAASTDAQYFGHQGSSYLGSSFWVGASALMRYEALRDIAIEREERGYRVQVFIKDDILIEDAAATVDLISKGWKVHHDHHRLSYSATPPDFGSLIIQRRRWANGGLLILPRLISFALRRPWSFNRLVDAAIRIPNLTSAATNGLFFSLFMLLPFDDAVVPPWIFVVTLPSLLLTGLDLRRAGYRWSHLLGVQAISVLLVPVNISGTIQSLRQAVTGHSIPFARTPKIAGRTPAPRVYIVAIYGIILYASSFAVFDAMSGRSSHAAFAAFNAAVLLFCLARYIGFRNSLEDLGIPMPRSGWSTLMRGEAREFRATLAVREKFAYEPGEV